MASFRAAIAALCLAAATNAAAQGYPSKPIRMIVPLAAASAVDNAAPCLWTNKASIIPIARSISAG